MFVKAQEKKLYEEVVQQISALIESGDLKVGDALPSETELAKSMGLSRATVREGLRILSLLGLIETRRGKGSFIKSRPASGLKLELTQKLRNMAVESFHVYQVDELIEPSIAKAAAECATEEDIIRMERALEDLRVAAQSGEPCDEHANRFHRAIVSCLHNPILDQLFELTQDIHQRDRRVVLSLDWVDPYEDHQKIFMAIKARDGEGAQQYMAKHLSNIGEIYDQVYGPETL